MKTYKEIFFEKDKEIEQLKKTNKALIEENQKLMEYIREKEQRALIRQFALNVEKEFKIGIGNNLDVPIENH